jgi:hypothetical protein
MKTFILIISGFISANAIAQSSINTAGKAISGSNGSIDFSIGETFGNYSSASAGSVKAGVIQPFVLSVTALPNVIDPAIRVFPNPVIVGNLSIELASYLHSTMIITDMDGRIVFEKLIDNASSSINLSLLNKGTYIVRIYSLKKKLIYSTKLLKL